MKVSCPSCQTNYNIDDKRIPPGGAKLKCARCQNTFPIKAGVPASAPAPAAPKPAPAAPAAVPLPGRASPQADPYAAYTDTEATRVVSIPVPSAAYRDNAAPATSEAIPLPGATAGQAIPLPGASNPYAGGDSSGDYADPYAAPPPPPEGNPYEDPYAAASHAGSIALPPPPSSEEPYPYAAMPPAPPNDPYAAPGADDPFTAHQQHTAEMDAFGLPPPPAGDPYAASPGADDPFALPPPPPGDPYAAASEVDDPFALPPTSEPAQASPSTVDVGLDFSEPPPASIPDALEFDPSAPARAGGDDLEADLSAPLPPAAGTADGLEMLSFIDDAAKNNGANKPKTNGRRFHVRRRSGKVFGPFEEGVVVKMLEDGQLLGNEDASTDGDTWTPIGTVPIFAAAIQKLMEGPGAPTAPAAAPVVPAAEPGAKTGQPPVNMERLNQLYGGRMAQVSVVDSTSRAEVILGHIKKRLPLVIAAAVVVLVLLVGLSFSATPYGAFGMKKFFPAQVKPGSSAYADVEGARKALLQDTFQSYKQARTLSEKALAGDEYPEVRAIWCQAVFYLQRRYSAAAGSDLARCRSADESSSLELLGDKNIEYIKYLAGNALTSRDPDTAIQLLQEAMGQDSNQGDVELALLLAEAQTARKQNAPAIDTLNQVLKKQPDLAKAHHALGNIYQAMGKAEESAKAYEAALKADPTHIISSVELAAVELLLRKDAQKGLEATERASDEKLQSQMGPAELSRARTLKGIALFQLARHQDAEKELRAALEKDPNSLLVKSYLARVMHAQRQFKDALPFYEAVVKAEPKNVEATEGYITTLVTLGMMEDAQKQVEEAAKRIPGNARIEYLYGRIDETRDINTSAEEHYTRAIKADAQLVEASVALGRLHLRLRRNDQAKEQFEAAASKAPESALVHVGLGELALAEGNTSRAQEEFNRAIGFDSNLADAHLGLSRLALLAGDLEKARKEADTALELDPYTLKGARQQRGLVLWRLGKRDDAITELEQAKKQEPRTASIPITLGAVYLDKGMASAAAKKETEASNSFKEAEVNLTLALKSEPSNPEANFYMGQVKGKRGEYTQALENMRLAVERSPTRADYRYAFGTLFREAKQPVDAMEQWKEAVKLDPKMADAHEALGQVHLERNEFSEAIASFQAALKVEPKRSRAQASIGDAYFTNMRWREAIRAYELALKGNPNITTAYYKLGRAWSELNQHAKAIDWYLKALSATPDNAEVWYDLGYAYKEKGKKKEAVKAFQEYLTRKPEAENRKEIEDEITFLE